MERVKATSVHDALNTLQSWLSDEQPLPTDAIDEAKDVLPSLSCSRLNLLGPD